MRPAYFIHTIYTRLRARIARVLHVPPSSRAAVEGQDSTQSRFDLARSLHQQGQLNDAEKIYQALLRDYPGDVDLLLLLGMVHGQRNNFTTAMEFIQQAIASAPDNAGAHGSLGNCLKGLGKYEDALASYDRALALQPNDADTLNNRGATLAELNRPAEALACVDRALAIRPDYVEALLNRGAALRALNRYKDALDAYDRVLDIDPYHAIAHYSRGVALENLGRLEAAWVSYDQALVARPDFVEALTRRGLVLHTLKRYEEALESHQRILQIVPAHTEALYNCGVVSHVLNRHNDALDYYDRALKLQPALEILTNRGLVLADLNRQQEALTSYERALEIKPDSAEAHLNRSLCRLQLGDFARGWEEYEWRWQQEQLKRVDRNFAQPLWSGVEPLNGKTILLHSEQGLGDTLQFCRYVKQTASLGAQVVLEVQPALLPLLAGFEGAARVLAKGGALPGFDWHCPLLSLPAAFKSSLSTIPCNVPYIPIDGALTDAWRNKLGKKTRLRAGLVWSGSATHNNDQNRSIALERMLPLLCDSVEWFSLQKEVRERDAGLLAARTDIVHLGEQLNNFADTAALITSMDIVITVDTSVTHLAGAMGKAVWILLPFNADWRWLLDRDDSPWYPTARLFRQPRLRDWESVITRVRSALSQQISERRD